MYASEKDLFKAKAEYYQEKYNEANERAAYLERRVIELARTVDNLGEQNDRLERALSRHEAD